MSQSTSPISVNPLNITSQYELKNLEKINNLNSSNLKTEESPEDKRKLTIKIKNLCGFLLTNATNKEAQEAATKCQNNNYDRKPLDELEELELNSKKITDSQLKEQKLSLLTNLISLELIGNELTDLPEDLADLNSLKRISLQGNKFTKVPSLFFQKSENKFKKLNFVYLRGNPILELPIELDRILAEPLPHSAIWVKTNSTIVAEVPSIQSNSQTDS